MSLSDAPLPASSRIVLTPLQMEHVYTHFRWNNDPELNRLDCEAPFQEESLRTFLRRFEQMVHAPRPDACDLEIHTREGHLIGIAYLDRVRLAHGHCRLGMTIGERDYWGQGYGRETMALLLHHAFVNLGLHRVWTEAFAFNIAWKRLLDGWGFTREGCLRDYLFRDGRYWDKDTYGLLDTEYARLPKGPAPAMRALRRHPENAPLRNVLHPALLHASDAA
ncbi:MAG: GNAT family N-acetyltransferase [Bacteroidetes bacterium]|jgi:RimJ/RimL family protein N-acetyltransferase|nr:GNAT family N-acetyltransferase [Bacteroidota bacterium]